MTPTDERAAVFTETRPLLFSIAYRMLGSVADAEDVVQDAYLRWQRTPELEVREPRAYLTTIVTRLAINELQSARAQRETYVGPWLPEPLVTEHAPDSSAAVELAESLSMAFLVMLERLSPIERAVLLLHDVFDFDHAEIARIVDKSEANCRQLLSRAKKHVVADEARFDVDREQAARLTQRFTDAARAGDIQAMLACSPTTSRCGRTAAARWPARRCGRSTARTRWRGSSPIGRSAPRHPAARHAPCRSTDSQASWCT